MDRKEAAEITRKALDQYGLKHWKVMITTNSMNSYLGLCVHKDKTIIINAHHCDMHPDFEVRNTILHEVAHALTPGHSHDNVWADKAKELGCTSVGPCSHLDLPEHVIDAIRSGQMVEMTLETETFTVSRPKFTITRIQDHCPECGKVAKEMFSGDYPAKDGDILRVITLECGHSIVKIIPCGTPYHLMVTNSWKPEVQNCEHEFTKTKCNKCGEFKLMDFQVESARFVEAALAAGKGCGVFHEMGLGKTLIALSYLKYNPKRTLFIVKSAITFQWFKEIIRVLGPTNFAQIISSTKTFIVPGLKSYIVSYDLLRRLDKKKIEELNIELVVLDECQQIKNVDSTRTQEVRKIVGKPTVKVIALSGTPWQNRGDEFFPVLNMIDPIKFYSYQNFLKTWVGYYFQGDKQKMGGLRNVERFQQYTKDIIIRKMYNDVMDEYPEVNRMKLEMQLDEMTQSAYDHAESEFVAWYNQYIIDGTEDNVSSIEILAQLTRARHIIGLAKIPATVAFMEEFYEENDRSMVIFVHHKDVAEILIAELKSKFPDVAIDRLAGSPTMDAMQKNEVAMRFSQRRTFLVASTRACGEGVDGLHKGGYDTILHERQWNAASEDQATPGRFKRIGQKSPVINITCVHADNTVDIDFDQYVERKRLQTHKGMGDSGDVATWSQDEAVKEMAQRIVARHNAKNKGKKIEISKVASPFQPHNRQVEEL